MAIFETSTLDAGRVNVLAVASPQTLVAGTAPTQVVTTATNSTSPITGGKWVIAGAMEDIEYAVVSPPVNAAGSALSGANTYSVTFTFFAQDNTTSLGTVVGPSVPYIQTINGQVVGTVFTHRLALPQALSGTAVTQTATPNLSGATISVPQAATTVQAVITLTGVQGTNYGQLTAGWTLGGHRRNRAG